MRIGSCSRGTITPTSAKISCEDELLHLAFSTVASSSLLQVTSLKALRSGSLCFSQSLQFFSCYGFSAYSFQSAGLSYMRYLCSPSLSLSSGLFAVSGRAYEITKRPLCTRDHNR